VMVVAQSTGPRRPLSYFLVFCSFSQDLLDEIYYLQKQIKQVKSIKITLFYELKLGERGM